MRINRSAAVVALASTASAAVTQKCATSNVCYSLSIPDSTASSGTGDIYFQITAPTSYQYVALGQGSGMAGANIFVMYTDSTGSNITLSPRLGTGHVMPQYTANSGITLLDGTGVSNGVMTANVRCSNCNSWSGGTMDFTGSSSSWIYAYKSGSELSSNSPSASISQHDTSGPFTFDLTAAKGGSDVNPFTSASAASSGGSSSSAGASTAGASTCKPRPSGSTQASAASAAAKTVAGSATANIASPTASGAYPWETYYPSGYPTGYSGYGHGGPPSKRDVSASETYCDEGSASPSSGSTSGTNVSGGGFSSSGLGEGSFAAFGGFGTYQRYISVLMAHGIMASLAFVILFPSGAIAIRTLSFPGLVWVHAAIQILSWLLFIAAFALGIYLANNLEMMNNAHPIIGMALFILLLFQPICGYLHHRYFKKYSRRMFWSYAHIWLGRIIITLGIINGGLGLQLAGNTKSGVVAYAVVAAIMYAAYLAAVVYGELKRSRNRSAPPKYTETVPSGDSSPVRREYYGGKVDR